MKPPPHEPYERGFDPDSTDTLPLPILREEDTGKLATLPPPPAPPSSLSPPAPVDPVRVRPRVRVADARAGAFTSTDTFHAATLSPMSARPVDTLDLAETLRDNELRLQKAVEKIGDLESALVGAQKRCRQLEEECGALREEAARALASAAVAPESVPAIDSAPASAPAPAHAPPPPPELASPPQTVSPPVPQLEALRRQNERLHEALSSMHARIGVQEAMLLEAETALQAALARHVPPEGSAPAAQPAPEIATDDAPDASGNALRVDWQARFIELETVLESERASAVARAQGQDDRLAGLQAELAALRNQGGAPVAAHRPAKPLPIGSVVRALVREEGGAEVVYPLGRHTTIGRTPDNDIQVNTTFVSRHHAVLLTGSEHCIIEDLNSTNGIIVNGQRVGRQLLHDGDVVTIGKTHFRYETRQ